MIDRDTVEGVLEAAEDDYISVPEIIYFVRHQAPDHFSRLRIAATVAEKLVMEGRIVPGDLTADGFAPWRQSREESAEYIVSECNRKADRGERVHPGEIAWFDIPSQTPARAEGEEKTRLDSPPAERPPS
ncbi:MULTISPECIES: hypothetical protein [Actinoalloteichus]|uniref:Uncharacterized protein n=1 Tax=Actinoalloteichus fjordicus TaxID=1612552 RepID=A0AAC9PPW5_9PSEU|nr:MULTISPECIES: hypothetical protein [Actinoalloteichus]APU12469.1 hypothetical protein UA74_01910 [Actinoalloteichus fjordicus]APU18422.1 hypothetical protein UA75_01915 [Actinoalloteichus sp. GBA129-24]